MRGLGRRIWGSSLRGSKSRLLLLNWSLKIRPLLFPHRPIGSLNTFSEKTFRSAPMDSGFGLLRVSRRGAPNPKPCFASWPYFLSRAYMSPQLHTLLWVIRRPWGACWMVAEGGEGENPLPFSLTAGKGPGPWWAGPQALGARAPSPLETWPTGPWGLDPATLTDFLQAKFNFLLRLKPIGSGSQNATITPNPLTLGGVGWFPKAELYSSMRGGVPVFAPAFQPLGRAPSP